MLKVLVVDDEQDFRELLGIILNRKGYQVKHADNGNTAKRMLSQEAFDVLITDLVMEECDGIELLKFTSEEYPLIETIIMTAFGSIENAVEAMKLGAFSYFIKSNNPEEIFLIWIRYRRLEN